MIKSILVGLDESEYSTAAVEHGLRLAREHGALLVGVAIVYEPLFRDNTPAEKLPPSYKSTYEQLVHEARHRCEALLARFAQEAVAAGVSFKLLEDEGLPAEQISIEAQRYDLVLLGQETHFNLDSTARSCNTLQKLLRNPPRPVVAVPKQPHGGSGVLVAYDGSVAASRALHAFVCSGLAREAPVHVLAVDPNDAIQAAKIADRAVEYLSLHGIAAHNISLRSGEPPSQLILDEAAARDIAMIVMGAYGHAGLAEWLFGSTTKHLLQKAPVPLFLYH